MTMLGLWVARYAGDKRLTLFHRVESEIVDRKVVRCGRELGHIDGTILTPVQSAPADLSCYHCKSRAG